MGSSKVRLEGLPENYFCDTTLGWDSLYSRRLASQLSMFYQIQNNLVNIQFQPVIQPATYFGRHDHKLKYCIPEATIDCYKFSFYPRAVRFWNKLPSSAVQAPSLLAFQAVTLPAILKMTPPVGAKLLLSSTLLLGLGKSPYFFQNDLFLWPNCREMSRFFKSRDISWQQIFRLNPVK